jgi:signal peptide peptidase SppA
MIKYPHILAAFCAELWAMEEVKFRAIVEFLEFACDGGQYTAEQLEARLPKRQETAAAKREGSVAVMPLHGAISNRMNMLGEISGGTSSEAWGKAFAAAVDNPQIKAIVIDVNSPGGHVQGADELSSQIFAARGSKPIVAHVNGNMASAALWIASAADEVVAMPSAEIGSIGIMAVHSDRTAAMEKMGVRQTVLTSSKYKAELAGALGEEAQAFQMSRLQEAHRIFVDRLSFNRDVDADTIERDWGQGRMLGANQAKRVGMIDRIGTLDETIARFAGPSKSFALQREKRALSL